MRISQPARRLSGLIAALGLLASCGDRAERKVEKSLAEQLASPALIFDLEESPSAAAALVLPANAGSPTLRSIAVPFSTEASEHRGELMTSWGSRDGVTLVSYLATPTAGSASLLPLRPVFESAGEVDFVRSDLPGPVYFMTSGLKRRFLFQGPTATQLGSASWTSAAAVASTSVERILVRLPPGAEIFEQQSSKRKPLQSSETASGKVKVYANAASGNAGLEPLDIVYQVPPTAQQTQIAEYAMKLFGVLLAPLAGIYMLTSDKVKDKRMRRITLGVAFSVEAVVIAFLLWWAFRVQSVAGVGAFVDIGLVVVGVVVSVVTARIKGE